MITRDEFPYLQQLVINDCYAHQNLTVPVFKEGEGFKHLILTGRNGSGKTTVLRALYKLVEHDATNDETSSQFIKIRKEWMQHPAHTSDQIRYWQHEIEQLGEKVIPLFHNIIDGEYQGLKSVASNSVFTFFEATRRVQVREVSTVTREDTLQQQLMNPNPLDSKKQPAEFFKQYLVNKKVFQVFDAMDGKTAGAQQQELFFNKLEETLAKIFEDPATKLEFVRENFEFYINLSDGRSFTFNQLSAGFSAFLSILTELLMRTDLLRKQANDYTYDPCGFVFIDEPETHLHLEMQYQILPLLTDLFPNLQFIVATHSPAVASSITGATVFDLSTGKVLGDVAAGSSFSELMQGHFGVANEFSNVADGIIDAIKRIVRLPDPAQARHELLDLLAEKGRYMSATLRLEVEAQLIGLE